MKKGVLIVCLLVSAVVLGQDSVNGRVGDSITSLRGVAADSLGTDTLALDTLVPVQRDYFSGMTAAKGPSKGLTLTGHPFFRFTDPVNLANKPRQWLGKEPLFYSIITLLLFFALIRNGFGRYVEDLLKSYFRTTVKQRQLKEQLLQSPLPSLLMNVFFLLSIGMFVALLFSHFELGTSIPFWYLYLYSVAGLLAIYTIKYLTLKLLGWVFQLSDATESYIFIVFTTNKVIGMFLIPFLVVLAFSYGLVNQAAMTACIIMIGGLLVYRFFLSYVSLKDKVKANFLHFLIYLLAFEVAPLLLINKLLFRFLA